MKVAIVGSGISGLTCAHVLGPHHDVVLYEASTRIGGHSNTVTVTDPTHGEVGVDTGFIVHNDRNYPNLTRLFTELGVETVDTEMSFGVADEATGFAYRATNLNTLLADRRNLLRPQLYRMLFDIARFYRSGAKFLAGGDDQTSLKEFLSNGRYSKTFVELHLVPMGASIWSADPASFDQFPARSLLRFLDNHGLLSAGNRPQWKAIKGGSRQYVDKILDQFEGTVLTGSPVLGIQRRPDGVEIFTDTSTEVFDAVVVACHSD
ncbi:MAG: NAD(P)/FAD-dependent oxidoreductase, partial [Acidimicrobiales bacterium]